MSITLLEMHQKQNGLMDRERWKDSEICDKISIINANVGPKRWTSKTFTMNFFQLLCMFEEF